jgi:hypothetical protein
MASRVITAQHIEGIKTTKDYISNGEFEKTLLGWKAYKDAADIRPTDGTSVTTPSFVSFALSSTTPLSGTKSLILTKASGNAQGEGISYDFTIDAKDKAKVLSINLSYLVNSGTFTPGNGSSFGDLIVYVYDVTNAVLIEPSSIKLLSNSTLSNPPNISLFFLASAFKSV